MEQATLLDRLTISEVSGVDDPANGVRGWAVLKDASASGDDLPVEAEAGAATVEEPTNVLEKIRRLVGIAPDRKDDQFDMDKDELNALLDEREDALIEKLAGVVNKSVETTEETPAPVVEDTPVVEATEAPAEVEAPVGLTADDLTKAIEDALAPYNSILEKTLDRIEGVEASLGIAARKSLEGQETQETETPSTKSTDRPIGIVAHALGNTRGGAR